MIHKPTDEELTIFFSKEESRTGIFETRARSFLAQFKYQYLMPVRAEYSVIGPDELNIWKD